jgi:PAS domain S-box-containing protein
MLTEHLVLAAFDHQENVAIVLTPTVPGQPPVIAETNDAFQRLMGLPHESIDGQQLSILVHSPAVPPEWLLLLDAINAGEPLRGELSCLTGSHKPFCFDFTLSHVRDPLSDRTHPVLTGRDNTVDRWKQQKQSATSALFALAFMKADVPLILVGEDGRIIMASPAMLAMSGFSEADLNGKPIGELTHPGDVARASAAYARHLASGGVYRTGLMARTKDGRMILVRLTSELVEHATLGRIRVVTLIPESKEATAVGRVEMVSLQPIRAACGESWEKVVDGYLNPRLSGDFPI